MTSNSIADLKKQLRQQARKQRQRLSEADQVQAQQQVALQFKQHIEAVEGCKIALYLQHDNELGTQSLISLLFAKSCQLFLPKLHPSIPNQLQFCRYYPDSLMTKNRFGIEEPLVDAFIDITDLDLIFLPLTAFDQRGNRLGMGGGYYDRALANVSRKNITLIGLAYDFQQCSHCPTGEFDQPLHKVLTPTRCLNFKV